MTINERSNFSTVARSCSARRFRRSVAIFILVFVLMAGRTFAAALTLYVAPNGNDRWSGRLAGPAANGKDGPLASLPAAVKAARQARSGGALANGITILLRAGTYELAEPLVLAPEDSGASAKQPFTIAAYPGEKPVLSGGRRLVGWKKVQGKPYLWQTEVPAVREGKEYFRQLFVNGQRKRRARSPNEGFFNIVGDYLSENPVKFKYRPGDIKKEWVSVGDVEVVALQKWVDLRQPIQSVDESAQIVTLTGRISPHTKEANARYYIENTSDALDQSGEWFLDRKTGLVTYWAEPGEDLTKLEVIAPALTAGLLHMAGDFAAKKAVRHVVLRELTFAYTDWTMDKEGYTDAQAAVKIRGDVLLEGAVNCAIEDCVFAHLGDYALELGRGCQSVNVVGNEMFDICAGGIRLGETTKRSDPFEQNHNHVVTDNHIHHVGQVFAPAVGMLILQSGTNHVAHNHIHDLFYTAISAGWNWGYQETPCRENVIEFNHLHDVGQNMLSDMGGVYTLGIQKGTVIRNNLIHDVNSHGYGGWGLYTDEGSSDIVLENNVVYRCKSAGFHQHYGRENIVRNNVFAFGKEHQLMRSREEAHTSFIFTNNIVYFDSGDLLGSYWANDNYRMDGNIYFDARPGATAETLRFAGATLEQWRQRGHDVHSVIADPLFIAPGQFDFRLKTGSPALKLGFKPIDLSTVGVRKKSARSGG